VKANADTTTADAMAVLVIVFVAFSDRPDAFGYFEMPAALVSVGRFAMGTPILRDNKIPAARPLCGSATLAAQGRRLTELPLRETGREWRMYLSASQ
jgi:hypothetical protein